MLDWLRKKIAFTGSVLFRGTLPPRADDFQGMEREGIAIRPVKPWPGTHWVLSLEHGQWGKASLACMREYVRPPRQIIDHSPELTDEERATITLGESGVQLTIETPGDNILRERKHALRFLRAAMGTDGLAAVDHVAQRFWSRDSLEEELIHDADLDVQQIYSMHLVTQEGSDQAVWLHSHGLDKVGAFDFDILRPCETICGTAADALRAMAYAIVEGSVDEKTTSFRLATPGGAVRCVTTDLFHQNAAPADAALRTQDASHCDHRVVLCEPVGGLFGRWSRRIKPSRFLAREIPDDTLFHFSNEATDLMAGRARATYGVFRQMAEEGAEFRFLSLVKLGYRVDGGGENDREHLWFKVEKCFDDSIEATLINQPFQISRMKEGDRGRHGIDIISDWTIMTPAGQVTPRSMTAMRAIRAHRDELRALMSKLVSQTQSAQ